MERPDGRLLTD